jgi:hypothetical protein
MTRFYSFRLRRVIFPNETNRGSKNEAHSLRRKQDINEQTLINNKERKQLGMKSFLSKVSLATAVAFACFAATLNAAVREVVTRYEASCQPHGVEILGWTAAEYLHGVALQSHAAFQGAGRIPINPQDVQIDHYDEQAQRLYLRQQGHSSSFRIPSKLLARIASWIDNGGTSLFTELEDMTPEKAKGMGMSRYDDGCWVATEFAGTPYARFCHYLDFPSDDLVDTNCEQTLHNYMKPRNAIRGWLQGSLENGDWIVSDLDSHFVVDLSGDSVRFSGTVYRYKRMLDLNAKKVFVWMVEDFQTSGYENTLVTQDEVKMHKGAIAFARDTALLRALHDGNPASWKDFESKFFDGEHVN